MVRIFKNINHFQGWTKRRKLREMKVSSGVKCLSKWIRLFLEEQFSIQDIKIKQKTNPHNYKGHQEGLNLKIDEKIDDRGLKKVSALE